jgi:hypothetical protein
MVGAREVSSEHSYWFYNSPSLPFNGIGRREGGEWCMNFITDLCLTMRLRMSGVYLYSSCMPSWCGQGQLYSVLRMHLRIQVFTLHMCMIKSGGIL